MKRNSVLSLIAVFLGVLSMGLGLSGCANNGKVFSKQYANKLLNEKLMSQKMVINRQLVNDVTTLSAGAFGKWMRTATKSEMKLQSIFIKKQQKIPNPSFKKYYGKPAGNFAGQIDKCVTRYGTVYGRKIYQCSYTFIFHPSKYYNNIYKKTADWTLYNGKLNIPSIVYRKKYISPHITELIFARGRTSRIWRIVNFNFNPFKSSYFAPTNAQLNELGTTP